MFDFKRNFMETHSEDVIAKAFQDDGCGGRLKPICNRRIEGRCYVRYVIVDGVQYWKINYLINQRPVTDPDYKPLVNRMYRVVMTAISLLESGGNRIVVYDDGR